MFQRIIFFSSFLFFTSCVAYKDLVLFRKDETPLPDIAAIDSLRKIDFTMQPDDILSITISSFDPVLAAPFNLVDPRMTANAQANSPFIGFLIDKNGEIDYPILGKVQAGKKTISEIKADIAEKIKPYLKNATVNIRRVNFKVTVMGEVLRPGAFNITSERVTILEAISMAGDLTPYSDRQKVMVAREENGKMTFAKVDLQSSDVFKSPYYFLHQNDMVYVDPLKNKRATVIDPATKYITWGGAGLSAISTIITIIVLLKK